MEQHKLKWCFKKVYQRQETDKIKLSKENKRAEKEGKGEEHIEGNITKETRKSEGRKNVKSSRRMEREETPQTIGE